MTTWRWMKAGCFGKPIARGKRHVLYVQLSEVEAAFGRSLSPEQLVAAGLRITQGQED